MRRTHLAVAVDSLAAEVYSCFEHVENSIHSAMKTMDSVRLSAVVDHLAAIPFVFWSAGHCTAFVVIMKIENPYGHAAEHRTVVHLLESQDCKLIQLA